MKLTTLRLMLALVPLLAGCKATPPPDSVAEEAASRLAARLSTLNLIATSKGWPVVNGTPEVPEASHAFYLGVPQSLPPIGGDLPHFWVRGAAGQPEFWILKMEGPAGASTWYGPLVLDEYGAPKAGAR